MTLQSSTVLGAALLICLLLLVGSLARASVPGLRRSALPASLIGGIVGLALSLAAVQAAPFVPQVATFADDARSTMRAWPGFLVALVFAGLLLERSSARPSKAMRNAVREGVVVWIIVLGQVVLGLLAALLVIAPATGAPVVFGQLIEIGFAGGPGTAAAMGAIFDEAGTFPGGRDLAMFMASAGILYSVVSGTVFVAIARRRGWTAGSAVEPSATIEPSRRGEDLMSTSTTVVDPPPILLRRRPIAPLDSIDPLALQLGFLALAFALGLLLQAIFVAIASQLLGSEAIRYLEKIPLFLFTLLGGLGVRTALGLVGRSDVIDGIAIRRLVGTTVDLLIVAALVSLRLDVVVDHAWGLALLLLLACGWTAFTLVVLSRQLLPREYWFELGIINYGMATGTTAQGMMLLRMVDPELKTDAAQDYALGAPFSAPFVGGGVLTVMLPFILDRVGAVAVVAVSAVSMIVLYAAALRMSSTTPAGPRTQSAP